MVGLFCAKAFWSSYFYSEVDGMAQELITSNYAASSTQAFNTGAVMLGAGLALTSMILVPAFAMRLGLSASLTGALRIALMKASSRAAAAKAVGQSSPRLLR